MNKLYLSFLFLIGLGTTYAQSGNQIMVAAHDEVNLFAQNRIVVNAVFPDEQVDYQNVEMLMNMESLNCDAFSHWD